MIKCILAEQGRGSGGSSIIPTKLEINSQPTKTSYKEGETFSIEGLKATVYYGIPNNTLVIGTAKIPDDIPYDILSIRPNNALSESNSKVTISYTESYVTVRADIPITVGSSTTTSWEWGEDGGVADETWFNGLNQYLANHTGASLTTNTGSPILGTTKSVTLTTPVLNTTTHLIRVIGVDQDADNTVTFQTANYLSQETTWSTLSHDTTNTTAARWIDSNCKARTECKNYKKALPGYNATTDTVPYVRIVSKGTCPDTNDSRNGTPVYNDEDVWLPSEREMGLDEYSPLSIANSTATNAECTYGKNFSYAYYINDSSRVKKRGDIEEIGKRYWERSRRYGQNTLVCSIDTDGTSSAAYYDYDEGLAPAFVVGNKTPTSKWISIDLPITANFQDICFGDKFVGIAYDGETVYSEDGITWKTGGSLPESTPLNPQWEHIVYGNNKYVCTNPYNLNWAYSLDGINWIETSVPTVQQGTAIIYGKNKFVSLAGINGYGLYSEDGISWNELSYPWDGFNDNTGSINSIAFDGDKFATLSQLGKYTYYSYDGINWNRNSIESDPIQSGLLAYGNNIFIALPQHGYKRGSTSYDGINWILDNFYCSIGNVCDISFGDGKFVAINKTKSSLSLNGHDWQEYDLPTTSFNWSCVTYGNGKFIALSTDGKAAILDASEFSNEYSSLAGEALAGYSKAITE